MKVRSLSGELVNGYRMFLGLAMVPGHRSILHQHVFSSNEANFESQNSEVYHGIESGITALESLGKIVITRGIQRILDKMLTDAMLEEHIKKKGKLSKKVEEIMVLAEL